MRDHERKTIAARAEGAKFNGRNYFEFVAYASRHDYENHKAVIFDGSGGERYNAATVIENDDWTDAEFTAIAQGIVMGLRCKYKHPIVALYWMNEKTLSELCGVWR